MKNHIPKKIDDPQIYIDANKINEFINTNNEYKLYSPESSNPDTGKCRQHVFKNDKDGKAQDICSKRYLVNEDCLAFPIEFLQGEDVKINLCKRCKQMMLNNIPHV